MIRKKIVISDHLTLHRWFICQSSQTEGNVFRIIYISGAFISVTYKLFLENIQPFSCYNRNCILRIYLTANNASSYMYNIMYAKYSFGYNMSKYICSDKIFPSVWLDWQINHRWRVKWSEITIFFLSLTFK